MNDFVEVISPGLFSTIQDQGRFGFRKYGSPTAGVMDEQSAALANHLLNNHSSSPVLEITMTGPKLLFSTSTLISIAGADISPKLNEHSISINKVIAIQKGDILSFGALRYGCRCYLAIKDGFQTEYILNSYSYFSNITTNNRIKKGDQLPIKKHVAKQSHFSTVKIDDEFFKTINIKCSKGPEYHLVSNSEIVFQSNFSISNDSNRMGYRLDGPAIPYPTAFEMLTSSVLPGTVQLTPSGQLIILMKDCQTTGGYPRILQLTTDGINKLSQKKAADLVALVLQE